MTMRFQRGVYTTQPAVLQVVNPCVLVVGMQGMCSFGVSVGNFRRVEVTRAHWSSQGLLRMKCCMFCEQPMSEPVPFDSLAQQVAVPADSNVRQSSQYAQGPTLVGQMLHQGPEFLASALFLEQAQHEQQLQQHFQRRLQQQQQSMQQQL